MKIYKFGGASVKNAERIRHLGEIVSQTEGPLVVVVSAMGKTTNNLEEFTRMLYPDATYEDMDFDRLYDQVVSTGELQSSRIVSAYLNHAGIANQWMDATAILRTDSHFREAQVDVETSLRLLTAFIQAHPARVYVTQGFIGGTADGMRTTLGREGSDYSAALFGNMLDAESVTLWKDVDGVYSADPRKVKDARLLRRLTYAEAEALAEQGAQIVHRKTFAPLQQKRIPLYVRPFLHPEQEGTVIE